jgi:hypothetical protein
MDKIQVTIHTVLGAERVEDVLIPFVLLAETHFREKGSIEKKTKRASCQWHRLCGCNRPDGGGDRNESEPGDRREHRHSVYAATAL